ncbi:MAG: restriction endonuclease [Lachnospiraceae bacterium]|nr:restriction endonuclease [Lachnospiraceae bacterium]
MKFVIELIIVFLGTITTGITGLAYYFSKKKRNIRKGKKTISVRDQLGDYKANSRRKYLTEKTIFDETYQHFKEKNADRMTGVEFEDYCIELLQLVGFDSVYPTKASGDRGVDITANKEGKTYAIQCKCYSSKLGNKCVQEVYSGRDIYNKDLAVVLTNSTFTKQAVSDAKSLDVLLWGREKLDEMQRMALKKIEIDIEKKALELQDPLLSDEYLTKKFFENERIILENSFFIENYELFNIKYHSSRYNPITEESFKLRFFVNKFFRIINYVLGGLTILLGFIAPPLFIFGFIFLMIGLLLYKRNKSMRNKLKKAMDIQEMCVEYKNSGEIPILMS